MCRENARDRSIHVRIIIIIIMYSRFRYKTEIFIIYFSVIDKLENYAKLGNSLNSLLLRYYYTPQPQTNDDKTFKIL